MSESSSSLLPADLALGVFDSGVGGLSIVKAILELMPQERVIYVADSAYAPYGDKSPQLIEQRTLKVGQWLAAHHVKAITIACNTATVVAARQLRHALHLPVVAIEPAIKPATQLTRNGRIGVLATSRTVASESVARLCEQYGQDRDIILQACPGWVECVESGQIDSAQTLSLLHQYLEPLLDKGVDTLVLGCTHYPFLREQIERIVGQDVLLIDPAQAVAKELARRMGREIEPTTSNTIKKSAHQLEFYCSGDSPRVERVVRQLWHGEVVFHYEPSLA